MTVSELDTFYFKFKNLLLAGKNATLTLKSEAGRAHVNLDVDLGHLLARAVPQQPHQVRNGPARMRRRERRAEARLNAGAAEATKSAEEVSKSTEIIEKINEDEQHSIAEEATDEVIEKVTDELCSDRELVILPKLMIMLLLKLNALTLETSGLFKMSIIIWGKVLNRCFKYLKLMQKISTTKLMYLKKWKKLFNLD